jgi:hypothetical protein
MMQALALRAMHHMLVYRVGLEHQQALRQEQLALFARFHVLTHRPTVPLLTLKGQSNFL